MHVLLNLTLGGGIEASNSIVIISEVLKAPSIFLNTRFLAFDIYLVETFDYSTRLAPRSLRLILYMQYIAVSLPEMIGLFLYLTIY